MSIETRYNLKNGQVAIHPGLPNEFGSSFFKVIEEKRKVDGSIVIYGSNQEIPVKAKDIESVEFVISD